MEDFVLTRPAADEHAPFYATYTKKVPEGPFLEILRDTGEAFCDFLAALPRERWDFRYAPGKWNIREVVQHVIDTERVMAYRLLCVSRGDQRALPGFDQNDYIAAARVNGRRPQSLVEEFRGLRESNLYLIGALEPDQMNLRGTASGHPVSVRALAYIIAGHLLHHDQILREKYASGA